MKDVIIKSLKENRWGIAIQIILIGVNIYLLTFPSKIIGNIIDLFYDLEANQENIMNNTYYLLGICIVLLLVRVIWKYYETVNNRSLERDMKMKLFKRFLKLKVKDIQKIKNGEIMSYFVKDTNEIRRVMYGLLSHGTRIVFTFIIAIFQMANGVNLYLTIAVIFPIFIGCFFILKIKKYVEISFKKAQDRFTEMSEYIQESTDSIRTTKAYSCEGEQLKTFIVKNRKVKQSNNTVDIYSNLLTMSLNICFGLCYATALLFGSKLVLEGTITVGELVTFNGYIGLFVGPVSWLPGLVTRIKRGQISYARLDKIFTLETEKINLKNIETGEALKGNIKIQNLSFHYPGILEKSLEGINVEIKQGQTIGIIGTIGSGKTTLMNLLIRLYNIPKGKIMIDGKDINEIPIEVLRKNICYITQDNFLFSSTLKENINLFDDDYSDEEIKISTKKSVVYDDIKEMPDGIETVIGERGADLSGGQKQRVAISRAFLKNSNILIFDDTFSALDNKTSEKLLENIKELAEGKTCIIISNKVSDVKNSDLILVLDYGEIVERGKHDELIDKQGIYYKFYQQQITKKEPSFLK